MPQVQQLVRQLRELGVQPGGVLLVHTAFSRVKTVEGGPLGLIKALRTALRADGTLVMPSMPDDDETIFDPCLSSCLGMGVVADTFWRLSGVLRSNSPHAFAAVGPLAAEITAPHPPDFPHGPDSPVGRVLARDGQILLLGVGHTANTTVHLAEYLGGARYRIKKQVLILRDGQPTRLDYREIDHCCQNFALVDGWLDARGLQRWGVINQAKVRLARSRDIVEVVSAQVRANETIFLHPPGTDEECDAAWAGLAAS